MFKGSGNAAGTRNFTTPGVAREYSMWIRPGKEFVSIRSPLSVANSATDRTFCKYIDSERTEGLRLILGVKGKLKHLSDS